MLNNLRIIDAIHFATIAHNGQIRKTNGMSAIVHAYGTAMLLSTYNYSEDLIVAALLHDVALDCKEYSIDDIEKRFGNEVAKLVLDVSESDKSLEWKTRKLNHIEHIKNVMFDSRVLCCANQIHNIYSLEKILRFRKKKYGRNLMLVNQKFYGIILLCVIVY